MPDIRPDQEDLLAEITGLRQRLAALEDEAAAPARSGLEPSRELYHTLFAASPLGIIVVEMPTQRLLTVNPTFCRLLGYAEDELLNRTIADITHPDDRALDEAALAERRAGVRGNLSFQKRYLHRDGSVVWVELHSTPLAEQDGMPTRVLGTVTDISASKQAAEELRASRERLDQAVRSTRAGLWDWRMPTDELLLNETWVGMLGYTLDELAPIDFNTFSSRVHPDDLPRVMATVDEYFAGATDYYESEFRLRRKDGDWIWVLARGEVVEWGADRRPLRMVGTHLDTTALKEAEIEREKIERQMLQTQKLESLGVLAGGIAHDFNNILMVVQGNAEMALDTVTADSSAHGCMETIIDAARRAADLCRQMLAYSGRGQFVIETVHLSQLVEDILPLVQSSLSKKSRLVLELGEGLPPLQGDLTQIRQVVMNLVLNASEALEDRPGDIRLVTGRCECSAAFLAGTYLHADLPAGDYVYFEVDDTGCGMDDATLQRIFEPFFTTKFTGRGLGMSAVLGIVRGHRGALDIRSRCGEGTTFRVYFPAAGGEVAEEALPALDVGADSPFGEGAVLLVDDEEAVREIGTRMLARLGLQVVSARDGAEALAVYARRRAEIEFVLLDLTMPEMDGDETYRRLREIDPGVRVVLCSGYSESEIENRFAERPAGFLQKPYTMEQLRTRLHAIRDAED